jgi:hypothetical protein
MRRLLRVWIPAAALIAAVGSAPAAAAAPVAPAGPAALSGAAPAVQVCGQGPAVVRPSSAILTCADDDAIAEHLRWSNWTATRATATGVVTWRGCSANCAGHKQWDSTAAAVTLTDPVHEAGKGILFTRLDLHVTGRTPAGFVRDAVFNEAPLPAAPPALPQAGGPASARPSVPSGVSAAPSGSLGYAQIEGFWVYAGGPSRSDGSYTYAQVAAAITGAESSFLPGILQPGQPYSTTGWGLWQITPGNSVPRYGTDFQLLDPWNNAEAAVSKYDAAGGFTPWTTWLDGAYAQFLQHTGPDLAVSDPGEYVQINSAPSGTPSSPAAHPGSTYGTLFPSINAPSVALTGQATAYVFWKGTDGDLWEAQGAATGALAGPANHDMGTLGSAPAAVVNSSGDTYVYWEGTNQDLYEAYWNGSKWAGPFNRGMGPLGSPPTAALTSSGTAYVFWKGTDGDLWEAKGPATGTLTGPDNLGLGTLGSAPTAGVAGNGNVYVYWEGTNQDLYETYWNGSAWTGATNRGMGPLGSRPSVAVTSSGTAYVFWKGTDGDLWEAQGAGTGALAGPYNKGMGTLGSGPTAGVGSNGSTYVYWKGLGPDYNLYEAYWNGSRWVGAYNRGMGPLD